MWEMQNLEPFEKGSIDILLSVKFFCGLITAPTSIH